MKKAFEQPMLNVISFAVQEPITWEDTPNEDGMVPGFSDIIENW